MGVGVNWDHIGNSVVTGLAEEKTGLGCQHSWGHPTGLPRLLLLTPPVNGVALPALAVSCLSGGTRMFNGWDQGLGVPEYTIRSSLSELLAEGEGGVRNGH